MSLRKRRMSPLSVDPVPAEGKNARTSFSLRTTPGDPLSIRKFAMVSKAAGAALRESCNHEVVTVFLCHRCQQGAKHVAQGGAGGSKTVGTRQRAEKDRTEDRGLRIEHERGKLTADGRGLGNSKAHGAKRKERAGDSRQKTARKQSRKLSAISFQLSAKRKRKTGSRR